MLLLVEADNTLLLLVGWELVGMCSFVLIGHWWEEKPNSDAAVKAFLTTRTGDVGLMIGVIVLFFGAGTFNIGVINATALNGGVNPNGQPASYHFDYGRTTSYGSSTSSASAGSGSSQVAVSRSVSGLAKNTTYHFRLVATWSSGARAATYAPTAPRASSGWHCWHCCWPNAKPWQCAATPLR